jgi:hypothetical protein
MNDIAAGDVTRAQADGLNLNLIGQRQDMEDQQKLRQLYAQPGFDPNKPENLPSIFAVSPRAGMAAQKAISDNQETQAKVGHLQAQTAQAEQATTASQFELGRKKLDTAMQIVTTARDPAMAHQLFQQAVQRGLMTPQEAAQKEQEVPTDPQGFQQWRDSSQQALVEADKRLTAAVQMQQQAETARHNQASEQNTVRGQNMQRETSLRAAGYDANGNLLGVGDQAGDPNGIVDAIGGYKVPESVALARVPPALKSQYLAAVMQKYPDYDPSTFGAKQKAARDFTSGIQGNALRSFAVAGQHLEQLGGLVNALDNGNVQLVNKLGNAWAEQTGNPAPTNFDAAKDVVSKEVVKAIVAGGGGVAEREELSKLMSNAKSPAQLRGVIEQYRGLMGAQHDALLDQRRAAGLPDSTLPGYSKPAAPKVAAGWKVEEVK